MQKKGAFKNAAYGIIKAAETDYSKRILKEGFVGAITYTYENGVETSEPNGNNLDYKGQKPQRGTVVIDKNGQIALAIHNETYCAEKGFEDSEVIISNKKPEECNFSSIYTDVVLNGADPQLSEGMIPIKWDGSKWVKADLKKKWYDYTNKEWANVVLVTEASRNTYINAEPGKEIIENDMLAYLVWIPRYRYKLFNVGFAKIDQQEIEIAFENKNTSKSNGSQNGEWLTHPAFTFGDDEINGFWVGKFEMTGDNDTTPTIKPSIAATYYLTISSAFNILKNFNNQTKYSITSDFDAHMMKNMEWGAVAYLSHSKYGKNGKIWSNPSSSLYGVITGCAYLYNTLNGQQASTTGNIYGIYDMNGGLDEYMMAAQYKSGSTTQINVAGSGFSQATIDSQEMAKYIDKYNYGASYTDYSRAKLGDATGETNGWYGGYASFIYSDFSWFTRGGGSYNSTQYNDIFVFGNDPGGLDVKICTTRLVVSDLK